MPTIDVISNDESLRWLAFVLDAAAKAFVILLLAGAAVLVLRRNSAAVRHAVWSLAAVAVLCVPLLSLALPQWQLPILPARQSELLECGDKSQRDAIAALDRPVEEPKAAAAPLRETDAAFQALPAEPAPTAAPSERSDAFRRAEVTALDRPQPESKAASAPLRDSAAALQKVEPQAAHWPAWVLLAWLAGCALMLLPLLTGSLVVHIRARRATAVTDPRWLAMLGAARQRLGVRRAVRLLQSGGSTVPLTWGLLRPVVLLPAEAGGWADDRRQIVLLHELAHVKRCDCLVQMLARLARAAHWFNPLTWLACRALRIERERACDDLVLASGHKASDYASHLLETVRELRPQRFPSLAAVAMAQRSQLEGRLLDILDAKRNRRSLTRWGLIVAAIFFAAIAVPLSIMKATAADDKAATTPATQPASRPTRPPPISDGRQLSERQKQMEDLAEKALILAREGKFDDAAAIVKRLDAAGTPQLGFYLFDMCYGYHAGIEKHSSGQPVHARARGPQERAEADRVESKYMNAYADFVEFRVLPQIAKAVSALPKVDKRESLELIQIIGVLLQLDRRWLQSGIPKASRTRFEDTLRPKTVVVLCRSIALIPADSTWPSYAWWTKELPKLKARLSKAGFDDAGQEKLWAEILKDAEALGNAATQPAADAAEIDRLIKQLGSDRQAEREIAQKKIISIGLPVLEALEKATSDADLERVARAKAARLQVEMYTAKPKADDEVTAKRKAKMLADPRQFSIIIRAHGVADDAPQLTLSGEAYHGIQDHPPRHFPTLLISREEAVSIIKALADGGHLARADEVVVAKKVPYPTGPVYSLMIVGASEGKAMTLLETLPAGVKGRRQLADLRPGLPEAAERQFVAVLETLGELAKRPPATVPATQPATQPAGNAAKYTVEAFPNIAKGVRFFEERMNSADVEARKNVLSELRFGPTVPEAERVAFYRRLLQDESPVLRGRAVETLDGMGKLADDELPRKFAGYHDGQIIDRDDPNLIRDLLKQCGKGDAAGGWAAYVLGLLRAKEAIPALEALCKDDNVFARYEAGRALMRCGKPDAGKAVLEKIIAGELQVCSDIMAKKVSEADEADNQRANPAYIMAAAQTLLDADPKQRRQVLGQLAQLMRYLESSKTPDAANKLPHLQHLLADATGKWFESAQKAQDWVDRADFSTGPASVPTTRASQPAE